MNNDPTTSVVDAITSSSVGIDPSFLVEPGVDYGSGPFDLDENAPAQGTLWGVVAVVFGLWFFMGRVAPSVKPRKKRK